MIITTEEELYDGNYVDLHFFIDGEFRKQAEVELIKEVKGKDRMTFIYNDSLYCFKWYKVKYPDGFVTNRKIYYLVSDNPNQVPEDYIDFYTFNFEHLAIDPEGCIDQLENLLQ